MDLLYLSHCVPYPPDKGEKIRAYEEIMALTKAHNIHLACFARSGEEAIHIDALKPYCGSVYAEVRALPRALTWAGVNFALGRSLNRAFFDSQKMRHYVTGLIEGKSLEGAVVYTVPMMQYVPAELPAVLDLVDVDSEKWRQYSLMKPFAWFYREESERLRTEEARAVAQARMTLLTTENEAGVFHGSAKQDTLLSLENGVNFDYFDPAATPALDALNGRRFVLFVGTMDYFPNIDAARWFVSEVFRPLRENDPQIEFLIVGNRPSKSVLHLERFEGVTVTGGVPDIRPYLAAAQAVVAPLRLARGIQNKVLEALAMGRYVLASPPVCQAFGDVLPHGVICCASAGDFQQAAMRSVAGCNVQLREQARKRFTWARNLARLVSVVASLKDHAQASDFPPVQ